MNVFIQLFGDQYNAQIIKNILIDFYDNIFRWPFDVHLLYLFAMILKLEIGPFDEWNGFINVFTTTATSMIYPNLIQMYIRRDVLLPYCDRITPDFW